jgi:hypothetical protein
MLTQTIFVAFKIMDLITWSWEWVFSPLWIGGIVFLLILIGGGIVYANMIENERSCRQRMYSSRLRLYDWLDKENKGGGNS